MKEGYKSRPVDRANAMLRAEARKKAGLCVMGVCNIPPEPQATMCKVHLAEMRARTLIRNQARRAAGLCRQCGRGPLATMVFCQECRDRLKAHAALTRKQAFHWCPCKQSHLRKEHVKLGFCSRLPCATRAVTGGIRCPVHEEAQQEQTRSRGQRYRTSLEDRKLCPRCGKEPREGHRKQCDSCATKTAGWQREREAALRELQQELSRLVAPYRRKGGSVMVSQEVYQRLAKAGMTQKSFKCYGTTVEIAPLVLEEVS